MAYRRASDAAKSLLSSASHHLLTPNPLDLPAVGSALDASLDWSLDAPPAMPARREAFGPTYSESNGSALAFKLDPANQFSPADQAQIATQAARSVIGADLGAQALHWFDGRSEPFRATHLPGNSAFGSNFATAVDRHGVMEAAATFGWSYDMTNQFPETIAQMAQMARAALPGLEPFYTTISCGRRAGGQQITFEIAKDTTFAALEPLMKAFGLGHRHAGLMTVGAFALGARYHLPARSATVTLLRSGSAVEMRLDINLDALPDAPAVLLPLLRLPMAERPTSLSSFDRWLTALTPDGYTGPGSVTVLSIRTRPDMAARMAVFLRPVAFEKPDTEADTAPPEPTPAQPQEAWAHEWSPDQMPHMGVA
ncbi:MAG: hypothetical protein AAF576_05795 [Pseudomonadota bacterium]